MLLFLLSISDDVIYDDKKQSWVEYSSLRIPSLCFLLTVGTLNMNSSLSITQELEDDPQVHASSYTILSRH